MKYCIQCGKEIKETAGFCPYCGNKQPTKATKTEPTKVVAETPKTTQTAEQQDSDKKGNLADEADALKEATKEKLSQVKEKGTDLGRAGINAVQHGVKAVQDEASESGGFWKSRKLVIPLVVVVALVVGIFITMAIVINSGGSRASDEKALKKIIADQKAMGATINEKNGASYKWNEEGRLVGINWNGCSLNGSISFSKLTCLESLSCGDNQLSSLDVSGCRNLKELYCDDNQLGKLDVSRCTALESLSCEDNLLGVLDVAKCTSLRYLGCADNQLTDLDVGSCEKLEVLYCDEDVKISGCSAGIIHYE